MLYHRLIGRSVAFVAVLMGAMPLSAAQPPTAVTMPVASSPTLVADDTTPYTVTTTLSDVDGYNDIRTVRVLFNHTESAPDANGGRGYLAWGKTDADIQQYGGTWAFADATGGGRWAYRTDTWGGTTYITPTSCTLAVGGKASGGTGTRTITFGFTVKPAWAFAPVMNDADLWIADASYMVGWIDNPNSFDVVSAPCTTVTPTPSAPVVTPISSSSVSVRINPADTTTYLYTLVMSPALPGREYVQFDGSLGAKPQWTSPAGWGTRVITGLTWGTTYSFQARASRTFAGWCPSGWSPAGQASTVDATPVIDPRGGSPFSTWVRGQCPYRSVSAGGWSPLWDLTNGSLARGLAGGLDADTYDWRDSTSGANWGLGGGQFTTLQFLQAARDDGAVPMLTANVFGGGYRNAADGGTFVCEYNNAEGLAADWVRYTNQILPNYRQGQESQLAGEDLRVFNGIANWGGRAKLLAPSEPAVPIVEYWEIGNEPELGGIGGFLSYHYLAPTDYRDRYRSIAQAMLAVDPTLKFGPCLISPHDPAGSGQWLSALAADPTIPIDFVSYHPYYSGIKAVWGWPAQMAGALRDYKAFLAGHAAGIRSILAGQNRANVGLVASEWNPVNWDAPGVAQSSMASAIGVVETCFSFAEDGVLGGTFWEQPQSKVGPTGAFAGLVADMGDTLVATGTQLGLSPDRATHRLYVTRRAADPRRLMIWGLNFDDALPVSLHLALAPCRLESAILRQYGKPGSDAAGGDTSLTTSSGMSWTSHDITAGFDPESFYLTLEDAEITVLVLTFDRTSRVDYDRDRDVDQSDFAHLQECLSGETIPQVDPTCADARLDADTDVDAADVAKFLQCVSGADQVANPDCPP